MMLQATRIFRDFFLRDGNMLCAARAALPPHNEQTQITTLTNLPSNNYPLSRARGANQMRDRGIRKSAGALAKVSVAYE